MSHILGQIVKHVIVKKGNEWDQRKRFEEYDRQDRLAHPNETQEKMKNI